MSTTSQFLYINNRYIATDVQGSISLKLEALIAALLEKLVRISPDARSNSNEPKRAHWQRKKNSGEVWICHDPIQQLNLKNLA
jgi:hypothetical protein